MNATVHKDGKLQEIKATIETSKSQPTLSPSWMIDFRGRVKFEWELDVSRRPATSHDITRLWQQNLDSTPRIKGGVAQSDVLMAGWYSNTRQVTKQTSV